MKKNPTPKKKTLQVRKIRPSAMESYMQGEIETLQAQVSNLQMDNDNLEKQLLRAKNTSSLLRAQLMAVTDDYVENTTLFQYRNQQLIKQRDKFRDQVEELQERMDTVNDN